MSASIPMAFLAAVGEREFSTALPPVGGALLYLAGIAFFLLLNAFFVASEFAIVKLRPGEVEGRAKELGRPPGRAVDLSGEQKGAYLSANQLGITFSSLALGFLGEPFARALVAPLLLALGAGPGWVYLVSLVLSYAAFTFLHVVIGELVPRAIGTRHPLSTAFVIANPLYRFHRSFRWASGLLELAARWTLRVVFRIDPATNPGPGNPAEELALLVARSGRSEEVTDTQREILINALELNDLWVRDVMTPRNEVVVLDADEPFSKTLDVALRSKHTRFPLVKGHLDQAIGLIHIKDLFKLLDDADPDLMRIKRELKIVPDTMPLDSLLKFFLKGHAHLAMAVDEFGTPVGVVFLDNVIEELVGEIQDEFDTDRSPFTRINPREFVVEGSMTLNDLADCEPTLELESGEVSTVGGHIIQRLGRFPEVGETLEILGHEAKVTSTDGRRVGQVHFRVLAPEDAVSEEADEELATPGRD